MLEQLRRCVRLIEARTWLQAIFIGFFILTAAGFEALGIGLIFPFIQLLADPSSIAKFGWLSDALSYFSFKADTALIIQLAWGLLALFVVKNIILTILHAIQLKFLHDNQAMLSIKLYRLYLFGPFRLHLTRNSSGLITNIIEASNAVFASVCMGYITLLSEATLIFGVACILFIADPVITLSAMVVLSIGFGGFFLIIKARLAVWGKLIQVAKQEMLMALQQGLHNLKEVKILGREEYVASCYHEPRWDLSRIARRKNMGENFLPRIWMEIIMVSCMLGSIIFFFESGKTSGELLATVSLFAAAAFRLLPSTNRALIALNGIKAGNYAVNLVYDDVILFEENEESQDVSDPVVFEDKIDLRHVSFTYPSSDQQVLKDVSLEIKKGQSIGLVGPSGSGKTTLVDIILGLLPPSTGDVHVDGRDVSNSIRTWRQQTGYVPQSIYIMDDTLERNIAFGVSTESIDPDKLQKAIDLSQLNEVIERLPEGTKTRMGERGARLSGGEAQRVGIARALYNDPPVLVLDEATAALDNETEHEINLAIDHLSGEKTLIIIAHRLSTVRRCDNLIMLREGTVVNSGSFDELLEGSKDFKRMVDFSEL